MLPYPRRSFVGYRLLQEYFALPEKFHFVDITGLEQVWAQGFKNTAELVFLFSGAGNEDRRQRLEIGISPKTFRLGCTPVINLFPQTAEPILLDQRKYEYPVVPDVRRPTPPRFSRWTRWPASMQRRARRSLIAPSIPTGTSVRAPAECFWTANRRPSVRANDDGPDIYLTLVDRSMRPAFPDADTLTVRTTCTNRDLPARLPFGNEDGDFELEANAPIKRIVALAEAHHALAAAHG